MSFYTGQANPTVSVTASRPLKTRWGGGPEAAQEKGSLFLCLFNSSSRQVRFKQTVNGNAKKFSFFFLFFSLCFSSRGSPSLRDTAERNQIKQELLMLLLFVVSRLKIIPLHWGMIQNGARRGWDKMKLWWIRVKRAIITATCCTGKCVEFIRRIWGLWQKRALVKSGYSFSECYMIFRQGKPKYCRLMFGLTMSKLFKKSFQNLMS